MKPLKTIAASAFAAAFFSTVALADGALIRPAAIVNGQLITNYELGLLAASGKSAQEAFETLAQKALIASLAAERNIAANPQQIAAAAENFAAEPPALAQIYAKNKVLQEALFQQIVNEAAIPAPTDAAVREFFAQNLAASGANFAENEAKIRAFLYNQAAEQAIGTFMEKARAAARIEIIEQ